MPDEDFECEIDLRSFMNPAPYAVSSVSRIVIFQCVMYNKSNNFNIFKKTDGAL